MLDELPPADTFAGRVRRVLLEELRLGAPSLARLAARMRMSERTLQRNLGREGASMQALLDEVRHQLSLRHLAESKESIAEISFLLGFAEVRACHRAFKRWTGLTPAAYRQARATPARAP
jgi:AraC-like DNA-binding protein